jgi:hypothetical protein
MDTIVTQFQHLQWLKSTSTELGRQKVAIMETMNFIEADDSEGHQVIISFLHECAEQIGAAKEVLDSAIRCITQ